MTVAPLTMIPTLAMRAAWPLVRDRIAALSAKRREAWLAEDVFHEMLVGNAYLWTTDGADGFVVLQIQSSPYERDLHVWIACNSTAAHAGEFIPQLVQIAAEQGCDRVTWESARRGWEREVPEAEVRFQYSVRVGGEHVGR